MALNADPVLENDSGWVELTLQVIKVILCLFFSYGVIGRHKKIPVMLSKVLNTNSQVSQSQQLIKLLCVTSPGHHLYLPLEPLLLYLLRLKFGICSRSRMTLEEKLGKESG